MKVSIEKLANNRKALKKLNLVHEQKGYRKSSMMFHWLKEEPGNRQIVVGREDGKIVGWGIGVPWVEDTWLGKAYEVGTMMVGLYVDKSCRGKGYGLEIGKQLFLLLKNAHACQRVMCQLRSPSASKMYIHLAKFIGAKRLPYTPNSLMKTSDWKFIKLP